MKKSALALLLFTLAAWLAAGDIVVTPPGQANVGATVSFRFNPGQEISGTFRWDFGDGHSESRPGLEISHVFAAPGNYRVTCFAENPAQGPANGEVMVNVVDNRRISPQGGNFRVGRRVNFQSENFNSNTLRWDFGDGTVESGPRHHGHSYQSPGNFTVKAFDNNGDTQTFSSCQVTIEADNRQLSASPNAPRANQSVAFSAQNFPGGGLRWDFGDGTVENGGPSQSHVFRQPGSFQVRAWESSGTPDDAVSLAVQVSPDNRQVQASPAPPRAGLAVQFTAANFPGSDLRWSFGDGKSESGGPVVTHVYAAPGNVQVQVWEQAEGQDSALKTSFAVQPDNRQVNVSGPADVFEGAEAVFEARGFASPSLMWDFGDGPVERGGSRQSHRFQRPGTFMLKVVEADSRNLPVEKRVQVMNDNRSLVLKSEIVFAGSEFEIEAQNFRGGSVNWDFGDGTVRTGPRLMKHRYAGLGLFRVRAIDYGGRDGKSIEKLIQVENDMRVLHMPVEIIAGEEVAMQLQNAPPGNFIWKFSDGDSRSGPELRGKVFRSPGPQKVTVADPTGKYPPLEKAIQVVPDRRLLKASDGFILPEESVTFSALNFKGPVRWDFGDGTVKENGQATERHVYAALGRYKVKAVDFNGQSSKVFSADVVVAEMTPGFEVQALELAFDNGKYYRVIAKNSPAPRFQLRVKARGRGVLSGQFMLDNMSIGLFQMVVQENQTAVLPRAQAPVLPALDLGLHALTVKLTNYSFSRRLPVLKYFVSAAGVIRIVSPEIDARVPAGEKVVLNWAIAGRKPLFEIAVSDVPFQFQDERQIQWLPVETATRHEFDPSPFKPGTWIYWQVRLLNESRMVQTTSEVASFRLSE